MCTKAKYIHYIELLAILLLFHNQVMTTKRSMNDIALNILPEYSFLFLCVFTTVGGNYQRLISVLQNPGL